LASKHLSHIFLTQSPEPSSYKPIASGGRSKEPPIKDRSQHGQYLKNKLNDAWKLAESENQSIAQHSTRNGVYLEFQGAEDFELELLSLENLSKHIRLLNVRTEVTSTLDDNGEKIEHSRDLATVFVPNKEQKYFLDKLQKYLDEETNTGKPKNLKLINSISSLRKALLVESFWSRGRMDRGVA
jgi:hypothetical protein